jgi:transcriptional regulator GlxA family with amidase domain
MDLALALLEEDFGKPLASEVAKHLVLHLKRPGVQSQFGNVLPEYEMLSPFTKQIQDLLKDKLEKAVSIEYMAESVNMSVRNFSRVFLKESGMTPGKFLEKMRLDQAKNMLEYRYEYRNDYGKVWFRKYNFPPPIVLKIFVPVSGTVS